jgi:pimeloyl-ACP methyl ester carboxylesterase
VIAVQQSSNPKTGAGYLQRRWLAGRMLMSYQSQGRFEIKPSLRETQYGHSYEIYGPQKPLRKIVLMVYGFTIAGEKEARLVRFAQSFAAAGFQVIVPILPGIKSINLETGDLDIIKDVMAALQNESDRSIGIVGFSVGGGLALVAATDPVFHGFVDPVILFGPYYSLPELWSDLWRKELLSPITDPEWNDFIWQQMVLAYREHCRLGFSTPELDELENLLQVYCFEKSLARKREAYERLIKPHGVLDPRSVPVDLDELEKLSPCGKLGKLPGRVLIIHDPQDPLSPCEQSKEIIAELQNRAYPDRQRLLISGMFSHVSPRGMLNLPDLVVILSIFGELFGE